MIEWTWIKTEAGKEMGSFNTYQNNCLIAQLEKEQKGIILEFLSKPGKWTNSDASENEKEWIVEG